MTSVPPSSNADHEDGQDPDLIAARLTKEFRQHIHGESD
jgi:hypothetical protein